MKLRTILALGLFVAASSFAQQKPAPPKPAAPASNVAPRTKDLSPSQVYALQKASEDVQRAQETLKGAQQTLNAVGMSIQQDCGCRITQQNGKLVGIVEASPAKK